MRAFLTLSFLWAIHACTNAAEPPLAVKFHQAPGALAKEATAQPWPHFLGPSYNCTSAEKALLKDFSARAPKPVWEVEKGRGHGSAVCADGRVVFLHRWQGRERVDCVDAATGASHWSHAYDAPYQDRYGSGDGTRTSPTIAGGRVYTFGISGMLHCLDAASGRVLWQHDCAKEFALEQNFFGHGGTPLVLGDRVIVQLGGRENVCAGAFDAATGELRWTAKHEWGASYASPVPATFHGRECVLIFAGGETRPPTGGLLCIDAANGKVLNETPHRAEIAESVNASSPLVAGNRVFVTEGYDAGGKMIEIAPDFSAKVAWEAPKFGAHFMTPIVVDGMVIGCSGMSSRLAELVAYDVASGKELWRDDLGGRFGKTNLLAAEGGVLCLGEFGDLLWLKVSRAGVQVLSSTKLFHAPETWSMPALASGLLYVCQNERGQGGSAPRVICYDLRGE